MPVPFTPCPKANIGPGESHPMVLEMTVEKKSLQDVKADFEWFESGKGSIAWEIPITYSSMFDSSKQYSTDVSYKIFKDSTEFKSSVIK